MRLSRLALAAPALLILSACQSSMFGGGPDEFAVTRNQPLVIPPDYALTPPRTGEAESGTTDPRNQALQALFGGPQARSQVEQSLLRSAEADQAALGARSVVGDPETRVVNRGELVQTIVAAPSGAGQEAAVTTPQ